MVCNDMWLVHDGEVRPWTKDWDAYKAMLMKELAADGGGL